MVQCDTEKGISKVQVIANLADFVTSPSFDFVYTLSNGVIVKTPNGTLIIHKDLKPTSVAICDECTCGRNVPIECNFGEIPTSNGPGYSLLAIILTGVGIVGLIFLLAIYLWKRRKPSTEEIPNNDNQEGGIIDVLPYYKRISLTEQPPHEYFNIVTQNDFDNTEL